MSYIYILPFISADLREHSQPSLIHLQNLVFNRLKVDNYICVMSILEKNRQCEIGHESRAKMQRVEREFVENANGTLNTIQLNKHQPDDVSEKSEYFL